MQPSQSVFFKYLDLLEKNFEGLSQQDCFTLGLTIASTAVDLKTVEKLIKERETQGMKDLAKSADQKRKAQFKFLETNCCLSKINLR